MQVRPHPPQHPRSLMPMARSINTIFFFNPELNNNLVFMDISPSSPISHALQACRACKQGKRRCDKRLPECSLCQRTGRKCNYTDTPASSDPAAELALMRARLDDLEERIAIASNHSFDDNPTYPSTLSSHNGLDQTDAETSGWDDIGSYGLSSKSKLPGKKFPTALFLDIDCFVLAGMRYSIPSISMPMVSDQSIVMNLSTSILICPL